MQWFLSLAPWLQALLCSLMMYLATALGASLVFFSEKFRDGALTALTGGAAGIMLAASFFSLIQPALGYPSALPSAVTVTLGFLLGGAFMWGTDVVFSRRTADTRRRRNRLLFLAVTMHNIPEGMAVGVAFAAAAGAPETVPAALLFAVGIAVQNFPEGSCVAFPLRAQGMSRGRSFFLSQSSGAVEVPACVLGALAATFIGGLLPWALSFCAGAMVAVVCAELLPECFQKKRGAALLGVIFGFCIMMLLDVALS